jgi:hypothetical protein
MTNLASSSGTKTTSSSKNPSSLIASIDGGVTFILGFEGIGGRLGDEEEEEDWVVRVVAYRRYDRVGGGRRDGPAMHCRAWTAGSRTRFRDEEAIERVMRRGAILIMDNCRLMMIRNKVRQSTT